MSTASDPQRALVELLRTTLAKDVRIESVWLSGSFGRGEGDNWSDIDVIAVVDEDDRAACLAEYAGPRNPVGETVLLMPLFGRIVHAVRPDWERYDILFLTPRELRAHNLSTLRPLTLESLAAAPATPAPAKSFRPDAERLEAAVKEFFRMLGLLPTAVERGEWLIAQEGVGLQRKALIELMTLANGVSPAQRGGVKRLNAYLSKEQRSAVESLQQPGARRDEIIAANLALARLFLPLARDMVTRELAVWPDALEKATRAHLERTLGVCI